MTLRLLRPVAFGAGAVFILTVALLLLPQFNLLNYYFALASAFVVPLVSGVVVSRLPPQATFRRTLGFASLICLGLLCIPLALVAVMSLFISNCAPAQGLLHYFVGPTIGTYVAMGIALWLHICSPKHSTQLMFGLWLSFALANVGWFYARPPIYTYNIFIGYMNGAVYDPLVQIHAAWATYRVWSIGLAVSWIVAAAIGHRKRHAGILLGLATCACAIWLTSDRQLTSDRIEETLGGRYETDNFVIIYDAHSKIANRIEYLAQDHEFRYAQLVDELGVHPAGKITSFIYANPEQKQRLMGAGRTYIAKPWSRMIHLNDLHVGASVLKHELVHIFGSEINDGWLGIPTTIGVIPQMALVEGFAVAYEAARGRLTPHQWSAAMRRLGIAPPLQKLLSSTGFLSTGSSKAYTLAGSFIRYLHDAYGQHAVRQLYKTGNVQIAFKNTLTKLISEWEEFVDDPQKVQLTDEDIALAEWRFDVPSRFHRVCALEIAEWENDARIAMQMGDLPTAVTLLERVYSYDRSFDKQLQLLQVLIRSRKLERGLEIATSLATDQDVGAVVRARALHASADIHWLIGDYATAHSSYKTLTELPLNLATKRRLAVSAYATSAERDPLMRLGIAHYLHWDGDPKDTEGEAATSHIRTLAATHDQDPVVNYLLARREAALGNDKQAASSYQRALQVGLPTLVLRREAHLQLAHCYRRLGELPKARAQYQAAKGLFLSRGYRATIDDWLARCQWLEQ